MCASSSNDGNPNASSKKSKKANNAAKAFNAQATNDIAALNRRAARFQREHEIERQKRHNSSHNPSPACSPYANPPLFNSRSGSPSNYDADEPEANPVRVPRRPRPPSRALSPVQNVPNWDRFTIVGTSQEIFKDYLRLTSVSHSTTHGRRLPAASVCVRTRACSDAPSFARRSRSRSKYGRITYCRRR